MTYKKDCTLDDMDIKIIMLNYNLYNESKVTKFDCVFNDMNEMIDKCILNQNVIVIANQSNDYDREIWKVKLLILRKLLN